MIWLLKSQYGVQHLEDLNQRDFEDLLLEQRGEVGEEEPDRFLFLDLGPREEKTKRLPFFRGEILYGKDLSRIVSVDRSPLFFYTIVSSCIHEAYRT